MSSPSYWTMIESFSNVLSTDLLLILSTSGFERAEKSGQSIRFSLTLSYSNLNGAIWTLTKLTSISFLKVWYWRSSINPYSNIFFKLFFLFFNTIVAALLVWTAVMTSGKLLSSSLMYAIDWSMFYLTSSKTSFNCSLLIGKSFLKTLTVSSQASLKMTATS